MSRSFVSASAVAPLCRSLLAALTAGAALVAGGTAFAVNGPAEGGRYSQQAGPPRTAGTIDSPADIAPPERYCYAWAFMNNTGQDANDLHVRLTGVLTVSSVYMGPENPFGAPDASSGYDAGTGTYSLNFGGATVADGDTAQIGLCTNQPLLALDQAGGTPPFSWTADGVPLATAPLFTGLRWRWLNRNQLEVQLTGDRQVSMTLLSLSLLDAGTKLGLDDLNEAVVSTLPMVGEFAPDPVPLNPGAASTVDVYFEPPVVTGDPLANTAALLEPNHPYVLEAVLSAQDDPGNTVRLYSQTLSPLAAVYVPIAFRN